MEWQPTATAPFDCDVEVAVINYNGTHALVFPVPFLFGGSRSRAANLASSSAS
jgi:hypothetical protein